MGERERVEVNLCVCLCDPLTRECEARRAGGAATCVVRSRFLLQPLSLAPSWPPGWRVEARSEWGANCRLPIALRLTHTHSNSSLSHRTAGCRHHQHHILNASARSRSDTLPQAAAFSLDGFELFFGTLGVFGKFSKICSQSARSVPPQTRTDQICWPISGRPERSFPQKRDQTFLFWPYLFGQQTRRSTGTLSLAIRSQCQSSVAGAPS